MTPLKGCAKAARIGIRNVHDELTARQDVLVAQLSLFQARYSQIIAHHQLLLEIDGIKTAYGLPD